MFMSINEIIFLCVVLTIIVAFVTWGITYKIMTMKKESTCIHHFERTINKRDNSDTVIIYMCTKCGKIKKIKL